MLKTFRISFRIKNTYRANSIIYMIKSLPLIKKLIPGSVYASGGLKRLADVVSGIYEFISIFIHKLIYFYLMMVLPIQYLKLSGAKSFLTIFFFLTICGAIGNTNMFNPTKDKYYAIFLMRIPAKSYALTNYLYFLCKGFIGFTVSALVFGRYLNVDLLNCLLMPVFFVTIKTIAAAINLYCHQRYHTKINENNLDWRIIVCILLFLVTYGLPIFKIYLPDFVFPFICAVTLIGSFYSVRFLIRYQDYRSVYKDLFSSGTFLQVNSESSSQIIQKTTLKKIDETAKADESKSGYAYFNDIFVKRHRSLIMKSSYRITIICASVLLVALIGCIIVPSIRTEINEMVIYYLPYFLFVMYFMNRGQRTTQAMFMNCDHSMLTYRFYRQPKVILNIFAARLKTVVSINLLPASVIAIGLPLLLYTTGGTDRWINYIILFVSIIAMSVFFSVHHMVLYYLLQPYNVNLETKSPLFSLVNTLTYIICYACIGAKVPTIIFGSLVIGFCILYIIIALILAYRLAPKTFKLR